MSAETSVLALVPHFRCERWLDHCLASLVEQTRPPDGIVVIDDASPEPPTRLVRRFPSVTLLRATENVGPYRLIQQVIDDTAFDWYMFQDADDWSAPDRLEQLLAGAARTGAQLIGSDYLMLAAGEGLTIPHAFPLDANAALSAAPTCHALQHPTSLVSRRLVERLGGYSSGLRFSGDDEFLRRAAHVAPVRNVSRVLYFRRHRLESLTTSADTGHGSPARRRLLDALGARARENAALVQRGEAPQLEPFARRAPVALEPVCGPFPLQPARRSVLSRATIRRAVSRLKGAAPAAAPPTLVLGGPASGADTVLWSLAQYPALSPMLDVSWVVAVADAAEKADDTIGARHATLSSDRRLRPLDVVEASPDDARRALAAAVSQVMAGGGPPERSWLGLAPPDPTLVGAFLRLYPDGRVVHVVRDADETALLLSRRSKAVTEPLSPERAYQAWLDAAHAGIECESVAGAGRVLRVRFGDLLDEPEVGLSRCLEFMGVAGDPACARMLTSLELETAGPSGSLRGDEGAVAAAMGDARQLSIALCGPRPNAPALVPPAPPAPVLPAPGPPEPEATGSRRAPAPSAPAPAAEHPESRPEPARTVGLRALVPEGAVVAAVTKGDPRLDDIEGVEVWHFPQAADGEWAGYHPAATADIVRHLDDLRDRGVRYFLVPPWTSWWLTHYAGLREHLLNDGRLVSEDRRLGTLFELGPVARETSSGSGGARRRPRRRRPSVSVLSWNTTHNPLGRAHVLAELLARRYDVEIVGARFDHFGTRTWAPLREMEFTLRTFAGGPFPEFQQALEDFARTITSDVLVVSKPRLPSFLLGMLARSLSPRPLILDVDDRELTFVGAATARSLDDLRARRDDELTNPHGRWWTQLCESLAGSADHVTVSNDALEALFGGTVIPHARDERVFDPSRVDRRAARARFGFAPDERIVLFGGTPRRHKGVIDLAAALREIGDARVRLCLIGTPELDAMHEELAPYADLISVAPPQPFALMPELVGSADVVAVLQDPTSEVSRYQMPAKVTDALAMQVPCLVRRVPPLESLVAGGRLEVVGDEGLAASLSTVLEDVEGARERAQGNRAVFLSEYSFSAVGPRLHQVVESLLERPPGPAPEQAEVLAFARERFGRATKEPDGRAPTPPAVTHPRSPRHRRERQSADGFDVVMFWKQYDTGLYGRRHDMLMQHLARSPRVGQVVQFDAPVDIAALRRPPDPELPTHTALLLERSLARVDGLETAPGLHQYSFVYGGERQGEGSFPQLEEYAIHVKEALARHGVGQRPVVFWVYPKNFEFPAIATAVGPDLVVSDVVDDHRTWLRPGAPNRDRVLRNYEEIAGLSDLVLVNCEAMQRLMSGMADSVHLVPNAAEYPEPAATDTFEVPRELRGLEGPIVGYVGNLSSRIDVDLLERLVTHRPDWNLVLVGSAHAGRDLAPLTRHPNVVFVGPRPYGDAKSYVRAFDVGIIPHVDDAMTRAMNPLKAFVYCAQGVPVVSTDIDNLGELRPLLSVASDADDFVDRVRRAIAAGRGPITAEADAILRRNSWQSRTQVVTDLVDAALRRKATGG